VTFEAHTCSAPDERSDRMRDIVLAHVPRGAIDVLDVGCGTGGLVFRLADALPRATIVGIDISSANTRAAEAARSARQVQTRARFQTADYLSYEAPPVDVIATDTALHFLHGGPDRLWTKLARDLRPSGVLIVSMAYDCAHNRILNFGRWFLRAIRCSMVDGLILAVARVAYGHAMDVDRLRERTAYMYIPAEQWMTPAVLQVLVPSVGLRLIAEQDVRATSAAELRQRVMVFQKQDHRGA